MAETRLTIDELIALNEEIAALVRAGVPLERGLAGVARDVRGALGRVAGSLSRRMSEEGCSLTEALEAESASIPPLYRAVVEAGVRAGRLPAALEGLAGFAGGLRELRSAIGVALLYPAIVLVLADVLFVAFAVFLMPRMVAAYEALGIEGSGAARSLAGVGALSPYWGPVGLVAIVVLAGLWARSGNALALKTGVFGRAPGMRRLVEQARAALFADLLAMLVERGVPLPEALSLAVEATGDRRLRRAVDGAAEAIRAGDRPRIVDTGALPPMLRWLIGGGPGVDDLPGALRHAASTYRRRALDRAELIRVLTPTLLLVVIGGSAALAYGLTLFVPFSRLLENLAA